jgi:hypothetical protein
MDFTTNSVPSASDLYKANSAKLQLETFKAETMISMMDKCADTCKLVYKESGIRDGRAEDVDCFKNCIAKGNKVSQALFS